MYGFQRCRSLLSPSRAFYSWRWPMRGWQIYPKSVKMWYVLEHIIVSAHQALTVPSAHRALTVPSANQAFSMLTYPEYWNLTWGSLQSKTGVTWSLYWLVYSLTLRSSTTEPVLDSRTWKNFYHLPDLCICQDWMIVTTIYVNHTCLGVLVLHKVLHKRTGLPSPWFRS